MINTFHRILCLCIWFFASIASGHWVYFEQYILYEVEGTPTYIHNGYYAFHIHSASSVNDINSFSVDGYYVFSDTGNHFLASELNTVKWDLKQVIKPKPNKENTCPQRSTDDRRAHVGFNVNGHYTPTINIRVIDRPSESGSEVQVSATEPILAQKHKKVYFNIDRSSISVVLPFQFPTGRKGSAEALKGLAQQLSLRSTVRFIDPLWNTNCNWQYTAMFSQPAHTLSTHAVPANTIAWLLEPPGDSATGSILLMSLYENNLPAALVSDLGAFGIYLPVAQPHNSAFPAESEKITIPDQYECDVNLVDGSSAPAPTTFQPASDRIHNYCSCWPAYIESYDSQSNSAAARKARYMYDALKSSQCKNRDDGIAHVLNDINYNRHSGLTREEKNQLMKLLKQAVAGELTGFQLWGIVVAPGYKLPGNNDTRRDRDDDGPAGSSICY